MARPFLIHGDIEYVSHCDVVRGINDPTGIQNRPFEQLQLHGKAPKALTDQNRPLVDINEARPVSIHAQRRFERTSSTRIASTLTRLSDCAESRSPLRTRTRTRTAICASSFLMPQTLLSYRLRTGPGKACSRLLDHIMQRNAAHTSPYFILSKSGVRVSWQMMRNRWDATRLLAADRVRASGSEEETKRIMQFQFRDIRPKAASEIADISEASALLGHSKEGITEREIGRAHV